MQRLLSLPLAAVIAVAGCLSPSHAAETEMRVLKPLLWKIEGKGLEKPSFLFGVTYPALPEGFHPLVDAAFNDCDVLETSGPVDEESMKSAAPLFSRTDGKTLEEALGPDLAAALSAQYKRINPQLEISLFKDTKTWVVAWFLPSLAQRMRRETSMEEVFFKRASRDQKEIRGLIPNAQHLAFLNSLPEEDQAVMLKGIIARLEKDQAAGIDGNELDLQRYRSGDEAALIKEAQSGFAETLAGHADLRERITKSLVTDANISFSNAVGTSLAASPGKSHFIVLPVGHIITEQGVRDRLAAAGYQVTRINP